MFLSHSWRIYVLRNIYVCIEKTDLVVQDLKSDVDASDNSVLVFEIFNLLTIAA